MLKCLQFILYLSYYQKTHRTRSDIIRKILTFAYDIPTNYVTKRKICEFFPLNQITLDTLQNISCLFIY